MLCHPQRLPVARKKLASAVTLHAFEIDDAWMRDSGPTFVTGPEGAWRCRLDF
jgi:agmatine deiminase